MRELLTSRGARTAFAIAAMCAILVAAIGVGYLAPARPQVALIAAAIVLLTGVTAVQPATIPVLAMAALPIVRRVGTGSVDFTMSDAVLGVAAVVAFLFTIRPLSAPMRGLLWLNALYQFATLFTVIVNPFTANQVEWVHAWLLVSGALLVGWAVGRAGLASGGLGLFVFVCTGLAVAVVIQAALQYARGDLGPVYASWPMGMHKNFSGTLFAFAALVAFARPAWLRWRTSFAMTAFVVLSMGLLASQSRQAIIGLGVALLLIAFREGRTRRRWSLLLFAVAPAMVLVASLVRDQVESNNQFNSVFQRITWFQETLDLWLLSPWFGHGLRFWVSGRTAIGYQPPNVALELLSTAGVVGLAAFSVMMFVALKILWELRPAYGTLAFTAVLSRLLQSQLDLFWISIQVSVPFAIVGVCLGALAADEADVDPDSVLSRLHRVAPERHPAPAAVIEEAG